MYTSDHNLVPCHLTTFAGVQNSVLIVEGISKTFYKHCKRMHSSAGAPGLSPTLGTMWGTLNFHLEELLLLCEEPGTRYHSLPQADSSTGIPLSVHAPQCRQCWQYQGDVRKFVKHGEILSLLISGRYVLQIDVTEKMNIWIQKNTKIKSCC